MIDTIHLYIRTDQLPLNYQKDFRHLFTDHETKIDYTGATNTGRFKNFKILFNESGMYLYGSLAKYYLGTNQKTLRKSDIIKAIDDLSQELSLPLYKARVNRVDLAENIITTQPINLYYNLLGTARYFQRWEINDNVAYQNGNRYILFYDKMREIQKSKEVPTRILNHKNVLRVEYRFLKHLTLARFLGLATVTVEDIVLHYPDLVNAWYDMFNKIDKHRNRIHFAPSVFAEKGLFDKQIRMIGVEAIGGMKAITEMVKAANRANQFEYSNKPSNILNRYKALMSTPKLTVISPLIDELEKKMRIAHFVNAEHPQLNYN